MNPGNDRSIENLVRLAGGREAPSDEGMRRARAAAEQSWRRGLEEAPRRRWTGWSFKAALACGAAAGVAVLAFQLNQRASLPIPVTVAQIAALDGAAAIKDNDGTRPVAVAADVRSGETLVTAEGRVSTSIPGGLSLRLDRRARVRFDGPERVTLLEGTVYVDSGGLNAGPPFTIATPAGEVNHVGTQFLVTVSAEITRVRVREGRVVLVTADGESNAVAAGDELEIRDGRSALRHGSPAFGPGWEWLVSVAPTIDVEDRPLAEFLAWLVREHGWQINYADDALQQRTHEIRLHGSMDGLDTPAMLERVALVTGLSLEARDGVLWVGARR